MGMKDVKMLKETLIARKTSLESELANVNEALDSIAKNPKLLKLVEMVIELKLLRE
jgi:vacuolar-type H+-ATPase subunit E/Vma4